jgi:hypothetical protein
MMGTDSVAYDRATVLDRVDDHPGLVLDYHASRGETPLTWGGAATEAVRLSGTVTPEDYEAVYGNDGATDPKTGARLVHPTRPGMELVISAQKSVAELWASSILAGPKDAERRTWATRHCGLPAARAGTAPNEEAFGPRGHLLAGPARPPRQECGRPSSATS